MSVKIQTVAKALPLYTSTTEEIISYLDSWLYGQEERFIRKVKKIFENAGVATRYSIMAPEEVFNKTSFEEKNNRYILEAIKLGRICLQNALDKAGLKGSDIDYIITVSCTGIMIPSLDAYLINALQLKQDIIRLPITEMGCAAGVSGIIYAKNMLASNPGKRAVVIAVEAPVATFQLDDYTMANIISAAIFGDGAACVILSSYPEDLGPEIVAEAMYHFYDTEDLMGFQLSNTGFKMVLDVDVPQKIASHFDAIVLPFLSKHHTTIAEVDHLIFHPGGKKIIHLVEALFHAMGKNLDATKEVLRLYGNVSSVTVLYILEHFLAQSLPKGDKGLMLSFGPGFSAQQILLQW